MLFHILIVVNSAFSGKKLNQSVDIFNQAEGSNSTEDVNIIKK